MIRPLWGLAGLLSCSLVSAQPLAEFRIDDHALVDDSSRARAFVVTPRMVAITEIDGNQGFSCGVRHDPAVLSLDGITMSADLSTIWSGSEPFIHQENIFETGFTLGVLYGLDAGGNILIPAGGHLDLVDAHYSLHPGYDPAEPISTTSVEFTDQLGVPPVQNTFTVLGQALIPSLVSGTVTIIRPIAPFRRGDCNDDGTVDISDGVRVLEALFLGSESPLCVAACDANADARSDISDAVYLFNYVLFGGPEPSDPFFECGNDGEDHCLEFSSCP